MMGFSLQKQLSFRIAQPVSRSVLLVHVNYKNHTVAFGPL